MTDRELEQRLRAWYRAEIDDGETAPMALRTSVAGMAHTPLTSPRLFGSRRSLALLAAAMLTALLIGGAVAVGSGLVRLPSVLPPALPEASANASAGPSPTQGETPSPATPLGGGLILVHDLGTTFGPVDLFTLNAGTGQQTRLGKLPWLHGRAYSFQWASDRKHVLIPDALGPGPVLDATTDAGGALTFICCKQLHDAGGWILSPRGDRIAGIHTSLLAAEGNLGVGDAIVILDVDGAGYRSLPLPDGADASAPISWAPDESAVVVAGCRPCNHARPGEAPTAVNHQHLFIVPVDGSPVRELLDETRATFGSPAWSPAGSTILIAKGSCAPSENPPVCPSVGGIALIVSVAVASGMQTTLTDGMNSSGAWSPNGRRIAYGDAAGLFVMDADGTHLVKLADGSIAAPSWSPDGEWLMFARQDGPWIVPAGGGDPRLLGNYLGAGW